MTFQCDKCEKIFERKLYFDRHISRKIPCNRELKCERCFKEFSHKSDLNKHLNRRFKCDNKREEIILVLELKDKELKIKYTELKIEQEKTKQEECKLKQVKLEKSTITNNIGTQNIETQNINIYNINDAKMIRPDSLYDAQKLIDANNVEETLCRMISHQFNNKDHPQNKCIGVNNKEIYSKIKNENSEEAEKLIKFNLVRHLFNKIIKDLCIEIPMQYEKYSEEEMFLHCLAQRDHIDDDSIKTVKRVGQYVGNSRNDRKVDNNIITQLGNSR